LRANRRTVRTRSRTVNLASVVLACCNIATIRYPHGRTGPIG
jgi:hypothetical protein